MASRAEETSSQQPYLVEVVEDITARIDLERRFRETFDHASGGIMHSWLDRRVLMINRKFCDMVGYSADELHQGSVRQIHHPAGTQTPSGFQDPHCFPQDIAPGNI